VACISRREIARRVGCTALWPATVPGAIALGQGVFLYSETPTLILLLDLKVLLFSSVSLTGLDDRGSVSGGLGFSVSHKAQTGSGARLAPYSVGSLLGSKAAGE
jgi:hypothetical protein